MNNGIEFEIKFGSRKTRAYLINELFGIASRPELQMNDKSILFQAISLFDRYYGDAKNSFERIKAIPLDKRLCTLKDIDNYDDFIRIDINNLSEKDLY